MVTKHFAITGPNEELEKAEIALSVMRHYVGYAWPSALFFDRNSWSHGALHAIRSYHIVFNLPEDWEDLIKLIDKFSHGRKPLPDVKTLYDWKKGTWDKTTTLK